MKNQVFNLIKRSFCVQKPSPVKICIVGSGPAGFYAAQHLAKIINPVEIDIYERLPVPFGLVRFGVAPDHPEVKNVINTFTKTIDNLGVRFFGNVSLGTDVTLKQLQEAYNVVLLSYGAEDNRKLNVPGETLTNVLPARRIVGWYNGISEDSNLKVDLSGEIVTIFGQGNVAVDVARILLTPIDILKKTDITQYALEALANSKIKEVRLVGRRGPLQAAFTIKELRELLRLENCRTVWNANDFEGIADQVPNLARPRKRITELMLKSVQEESKVCRDKSLQFMFFKSPLEILGSSQVEKVCLGVNKLEGKDVLNQKAVLIGQKEFFPTDLVVTSIGYKSFRVDRDIPFDDERGIVKNEQGKIADGLYVNGWLGTGPVGVILTTMNNAFTTAELICNDLKKQTTEDNKGGYQVVEKILKGKNIQVVTWKDWLKIDAYEQEEGKKLEKPREKLVDIKKMLEIASS